MATPVTVSITQYVPHDASCRAVLFIEGRMADLALTPAGLERCPDSFAYETISGEFAALYQEQFELFEQDYERLKAVPLPLVDAAQYGLSGVHPADVLRAAFRQMTRETAQGDA